MNFKIDMSKFQTALDETGDMMKQSRGLGSLEYKIGHKAAIVLGVLAILTESGVLKITKVREPVKRKPKKKK
jgi:hypothetical protein